MSQYITTHNADGQAVFSNLIPTEHLDKPIPGGYIRIIWSSHEFAPNVTTDADIERYSQDRTSGSFAGTRRVCPENGTAHAIISFEPGAESPVHRTMTLDVQVILEGELEYHLDSGEKRRVKAGDTIVQRAVMHKWVNVTPNKGWARIFGTLQAIKEPLEVGGKELHMEWLH